MRGCVAAGMVAAINYLGSILHLLSNEDFQKELTRNYEFLNESTLRPDVYCSIPSF